MAEISLRAVALRFAVFAAEIRFSLILHRFCVLFSAKFLLSLHGFALNRSLIVSEMKIIDLDWVEGCKAKLVVE